MPKARGATDPDAAAARSNGENGWAGVSVTHSPLGGAGSRLGGKVKPAAAAVWGVGEGAGETQGSQLSDEPATPPRPAGEGK